MEYEKLKKKVDRINKRHRKAFEKVPVAERLLFISHCITKEQRDKIEEIAKQRGYRYYVVGGGSIVLKKIEQDKPGAVLGIACLRELELAIKEIKKIPLQAVLLKTDGCKDTTVDLDYVDEVLSL